MRTPLLSVGIPFFNAERGLLDSIRSIFAQTYTNWELILVDDGSTDGSLEIAHLIDDPRVKLLPTDGQNRRLPARLNQITEAAKGDFIARMDADDLSHPERFKQQLDFLQNHPEVDVVGSSACILDKQYQPSRKLIVAETNEDIFKNKFGSGVSIVHPAIMARSKWFRQWPYDKRDVRCEDYGLWMRSCRNSTFANIPMMLYFKDELFSFSISKYAKSKNTAARIIWQQASKELGILKATYYVGKRYLNIGTYAGIAILGLQHKLISRRYKDLGQLERKEISMALDIIKKTEVPIRNTN